MTTQPNKLQAFITKHPMALAVPIAMIMYYTLAFLVNPFVSLWHRSTVYDIAVQLLGTAAFCTVILIGSLRISRVLNQRLAWSDKPLQRVIVQFIAQLMLAFIWSSVFSFLMALVFYQINIFDVLRSQELNTEQQVNMWRYTFSSIMLSIVISFMLGARNFRVERDALRLQAAQLKQIAMQAELQSLKLQLDPHFMFNNLSTLSGLISDDRDLAQSFIEHLARVYRYMIMNIHSDTVTLQKELKFIQSYIYLIKIRHSENVDIRINIPEEYLQKLIPPITLQLLIENAIKHNIASEALPLKISIFIRDGKLFVSNTLQRLPNAALTSSKVGLENIKARYRIVFGSEPLISQDDHEFSVSLPLAD
ncbi:MAG: histidine kinase [Chryseolinea sp.]